MNSQELMRNRQKFRSRINHNKFKIRGIHGLCLNSTAYFILKCVILSEPIPNLQLTPNKGKKLSLYFEKQTKLMNSLGYHQITNHEWIFSFMSDIKVKCDNVLLLLNCYKTWFVFNSFNRVHFTTISNNNNNELWSHDTFIVKLKPRNYFRFIGIV